MLSTIQKLILYIKNFSSVTYAQWSEWGKCEYDAINGYQSKRMRLCYARIEGEFLPTNICPSIIQSRWCQKEEVEFDSKVEVKTEISDRKGKFYRFQRGAREKITQLENIQSILHK